MENVSQALQDSSTIYLPVFEAMKVLGKKDIPSIIAIEGRCGSGKSFLAALLSQNFDCNVFHMDDFFLPFEMKTEKRLAEPGGNVHYERFKEEILISLQKGEDVTYRRYNCSKGVLEEPIHVEFKKLTVVEGSYCMHPILQDAYSYKVFLTLDNRVQLQRILKRNGEEKLQNFTQRWIPLEEQYFSELSIEEQCDIIIDTSSI